MLRSFSRKVRIIVCLCGFFSLLSAREMYVLDLDKSLEIAMKRSYKMLTLKENLLSAEFELKATANQFRTNVNLTIKAPNYTETISSYSDSLGVHYIPIKQSTYNASLVLTQPLPTDGQIYLSSGFYTLEDFYNRRNSIQLNTRLGFEQPIEAFYAYNRIRTGLKQARLNYELSKKQLLRADLDLRYEVSQGFYRLLSAIEREKISLQTLTYQKETFELAQNKYKAGVIAEVEALQMEVDLGDAMNDYDIAKSNRASLANSFKQLIGISLGDSIELRFDLSYPIVTIDEEKAIEMGMKNRLEIREKEINKELSEISIKLAKLNSQSLALDRNRLSQAYISRLEAFISYQLLLADLARKTFYNFQNNTSLVNL
ncbi:MAG: TolC family protein [Candidatus Neomarinimicrobiota bacterium]